MDFKSLKFTWKITNFSQQKLKNGPGKWIRSRAFSVGCEADMKFILQFYPQGEVQSGATEVTNGEKWASLYLVIACNKTYETSHLIEFSILDADGETLCSCHFHKKNPFNSKYGYPKLIRLTKLENPANKLLTNDTLTICCRVEETKSKTEECKCQIEEPKTTQTRCVLSEGLASITDADFVFKVGSEKIAVHRALLAARSPVFAAMFQQDMQQKKTNEIEVKYEAPAAFKALLRFIYTGRCQVEISTKELFMAAIEYGIQDLIQICAIEMVKILNVDNVVDFLVLSDLHQANGLKEGAIRFINQNAAAVTKTPSWTALSKTHPHLIVDLYCKSIKDK